MDFKKIKTLVKQEKLGKMIVSIDVVTGGLSHEMYKVVTDKATYAIKKLNSGVMKRKEAYANFVFSEKVTEIAKAKGISAIGAIKLENDIMRKIEDDFFMVFPWLEGKTLKAEEITKQHCEIIGKVLANIHNIDFSEIENTDKKKIEFEEVDWNEYFLLAKKQNKDYASILEENSDLLYELNKKTKEAVQYANQNLVISHTDSDRKNVMWQGNTPFIIDWEASGYINPTIELIQVAWYWSGGDVENLDYDKFEMIINTYKQYSKRKIDENIDKTIYADIYGGLEWVAYNLKRSLCIGMSYEKDEIELAENEIRQSIGEIKYNVSQMGKMTEILQEKFERR